MQQSDRLKSLGTLAAGIAHEIRNPLATINFNTQLLQRELTLDRAEQQMFDDMEREIKKIDRIVQQVLHFARPREPQFLLHQLNDVVRSCCNLARVFLSRDNLEVTFHLSEDLPLLVIDFNQISQVIMNLLINAIEAMPEGGRLSLVTDLKYDPPALVFEVTDTGSGILDEDKERIFDPFFTRKPDGTGLGLSICRQILEKHGAYIEVESAPDVGTTFRIVFPLSSINDSLVHTANPPMTE
jgi:signal transduction histidine kinase